MSTALLDAETGARALEILDETIPDIVLLDGTNLPDANGIDILRRIRARNLPCAVVVVTAHGSVKIAVEAMRERRLRLHHEAVPARPADHHGAQCAGTPATADFGRGQRDRQGRQILRLDRRLVADAVIRTMSSRAAASSRATVFITEREQRRQELCAGAIHQLSPRRNGPFVAVNCGAIPRELMESEMFGHVKGAFTGAVTSRDGAISRALGGTLFLDEICEMDLSLQVKLLRVIQSGEFQKVGGNDIERADVRYVCATNREPWGEVQAGRFREDLYYRLHVVPCAMPPLRARDDDVLLLARHFLALYAKEEGKEFADFDEGAMRALRRYPWPGNIRELQNVLRNAVLFNQGSLVTEAMLNRLDPNAVPRPVAVPSAIAALTPAPRSAGGRRCAGEAAMARREGSDRGSDRAVQRQYPARGGVAGDKPVDDLSPQGRVGKGTPAVGRLIRARGRPHRVPRGAFPG